MELLGPGDCLFLLNGQPVQAVSLVAFGGSWEPASQLSAGEHGEWDVAGTIYEEPRAEKPGSMGSGSCL